VPLLEGLWWVDDMKKFDVKKSSRCFKPGIDKIYPIEQIVVSHSYVVKWYNLNKPF